MRNIYLSYKERQKRKTLKRNRIRVKKDFVRYMLIYFDSHFKILKVFDYNEKPNNKTTFFNLETLKQQALKIIKEKKKSLTLSKQTILTLKDKNINYEKIF